MKKFEILVKGIEVSYLKINENDYISLTDIARYKNSEDPRYVIQNWMKSRATIEFLGLWEILNNNNFNRVDFDTVKNESGSNTFVMTPKKWINITCALGLLSKCGRFSSGTFAHKDIAFEFATWISPEFKLYLIKEFQRLKQRENSKDSTEWNVKRILAKVNYKVHTDSIKENLIPKHLSKVQIERVYASEADILNMALFGLTAHEWRDSNPDKKGNIRDYSEVSQLVCLAGLESLNAEFIRQGLPRKDRLVRLNEIAIIKMQSILGNTSLKELEKM